MGLGKTLQAISVLASLHASATAAGRQPGPYLVIAPLSTLSGWAEQLARFYPSLRVLTYSGAAAERGKVRQSLVGSARDAVLLASYEPVLADGGELKKLSWDYVVIDEAHRLKNRQAVLYRCLLDELDLGRVPRLLLTGTPVQNEPAELWALLHFVLPEVRSPHRAGCAGASLEQPRTPRYLRALRRPPAHPRACPLARLATLPSSARPSDL